MYIFENPVLQRELLVNLRTNRAFLLLAVYQLLLAAVVLVAWPSAERLDLTSNPQSAQKLVNLFFLGQYVIASLMAPSFAAGAITGGAVTVNDCVPEHLQALIDKLRECGFSISTDASSITLEATDSWTSTDISTAPYPGFPTDLQAQFMALMTQAEGTSVVTEGIFENRFMHVQELVRLGADITPMSQVAIVRGKAGGLSAAEVMATDLRASASLVLAGLVATGATRVNRIYHLDRGYEKLEQKLASLGADIARV